LTAAFNALDGTINARAEQASAAIKATRPKIDPHGTDESFPTTEAKFLRFVIHGFTTAPAAKKRPNAPGGKLTEFQVWSADGANVALASHGSKAEGAKSTTAEDFPEAYGPQYCIDGMMGEGWFIGEPPVLTLTFAKLERINRITFINARGERGTDESKVAGATPCEYEVQTSLDGQTWQTVATDEGREPWTPAHRVAKARRSVITEEEVAQLEVIEKQLARVEAKLNAVPKLTQVWAGNYSQPKSPPLSTKAGIP